MLNSDLSVGEWNTILKILDWFIHEGLQNILNS